MRQRMLAMTCAVLWAAPAAAQLPAIGAPRGVLRLELGGDFSSMSEQLVDGASQPYRNQFSAAIAPGLFPDLAPTQALVARLSGIGTYALSAGRATMRAQASVGTLQLGATLGLTTRLSLFGTAPIVRQGIKLDYRVDTTGANAGFNPADPVFGTTQGAAATSAFLSEFGIALDTLSTRLAAGYYDSNPTDKALAQATLASGTTYLAGLDSLFVTPGAAGPLVPVASSAAGQAMASTVTGTQGTLTALGISSFTTPLPLPAATLTTAEYQQFIASSAGPIAAVPVADSATFLLGDIEVGAIYTLIDRWNRPGQPGGLRLTAQGSVRLPTGARPLSNDFVSIRSSPGGTGVRASLAADVGGGKFGARMAASYTNQFASTLVQRVTPPSQPIPWADRTAGLRIDPGNEVTISAMPYFQPAPGLGLVAVVRYWSHGADAVAYASATDSVPGVSAGLLELGTRRTATVLGGGLSYAPAQEGASVPLEAFWIYEKVVAASGGVVPKAGTIRMGLRVPVRLWDGSAE